MHSIRNADIRPELGPDIREMHRNGSQDFAIPGGLYFKVPSAVSSHLDTDSGDSLSKYLKPAVAGLSCYDIANLFVAISAVLGDLGNWLFIQEQLKS